MAADGSSQRRRENMDITCPRRTEIHIHPLRFEGNGITALLIAPEFAIVAFLADQNYLISVYQRTGTRGRPRTDDRIHGNRWRMSQVFAPKNCIRNAWADFASTSSRHPLKRRKTSVARKAHACGRQPRGGFLSGTRTWPFLPGWHSARIAAATGFSSRPGSMRLSGPPKRVIAE